MRILLVLSVIGRLLRLFSTAFAPPMLLAGVDGQWWAFFSFGVALIAALSVGSVLSGLSRMARVLYRGEAMAVVAGTWLIVAIFAAIPYCFERIPPVDALFEAMSGLTTTGATILRDFSVHGRAFFLWRAMTQWFGGVGVIALFIVILPRLGIAGRQIFFAEASEVSETISPQIQSAARRLWLLYGCLTAALAFLLWVSGFSPYDAIVHSMTTLSAGGFSPNGESLAGYGNSAAEWILVIFMILGGTSFTLQWKAFTSRPTAFLRDGEFLFYVGVSGGGALLLAILLTRGIPDLEALRDASFQSASLISSTGFASVDYDRWSDAAKAVLVAIMLVGGCAGSAAGGAKAIRHLLVIKFLRREMTQVLHPYSVLSLRYGNRVIPLSVMRAVFTLVVLYLLGYLFTGLAVVVLGADLTTGFSASLACLGNIGPGFGAAGPMANYADFPVASKLILTAAMWVGRLEIVTVLALLHPHVLRNLRLRGSLR